MTEKTSVNPDYRKQVPLRLDPALYEMIATEAAAQTPKGISANEFICNILTARFTPGEGMIAKDRVAQIVRAAVTIAQDATGWRIESGWVRDEIISNVDRDLGLTRRPETNSVSA